MLYYIFLGLYFILDLKKVIIFIANIYFKFVLYIHVVILKTKKTVFIYISIKHRNRITLKYKSIAA